MFQLKVYFVYGFRLNFQNSGIIHGKLGLFEFISIFHYFLNLNSTEQSVLCIYLSRIKSESIFNRVILQVTKIFYWSEIFYSLDCGKRFLAHVAVCRYDLT